MDIKVYNTLSGRKEELQPIEPGKIKMYVCGPTVYDMAHVGHARSCVAFDVVVRYLRRHYDVTYVRNYTDVDDKIIARANELNEPPFELSERFIKEFQTDMSALGLSEPDIEPKVTDHIDAIISLIQRLVDRGMAYASGGDVYYAVDKFEGYGKLSRRSLEDMEAGARVEVSELKNHPMDFALWKSVKPGEPSWDSPWGAGRPGWHIECSAMSSRYLGDTFDIHGGGKDLVFPHHENEIAQSEGSCGKLYVKYWMHNGFVNVDNEKMSKSLGNFFTVRDLCEKYDGQTIRFYLLTTHYRSPINFSDVALDEAAARLKYLCETQARLQGALQGKEAQNTGVAFREPWVESIVTRFDETMADDFNTAKALGELSDAFKLVNEILDKPRDEASDTATLLAIQEALGQIGQVLGIFLDDPNEVLERMASRRQLNQGVDAERVERLVVERREARGSKDFKRADEIRDELAAMGVVLKDQGGQTTWELM